MKKILILLYVLVVLSLNSYAEVKWESVFFENFENGISENFTKNAVFFKEKVKIVDGKKSLSGAKSLEITGFGSRARHYLNLFKDGLEGGYFYKISFKYKVSKLAYNIFSQKPFFILKKYIKKFGLKEFICKMSTKNAVVSNVVISVLLLIGLCFSYLNNIVYANFIIGVLFLLWSSVTLGGILLHYYLLNR